MPYATQADMIARFGLPRLQQLTDVGDPLTGALVATVLQTRLDDASAEIDGYLAGRMAVPLVAPPPIVKLLCSRIALYLLLGPSASDVDQADVKAARAYLASVAKGEISLAAPDQVVAVSGAGAVQFSAGAKDWARES